MLYLAVLLTLYNRGLNYEEFRTVKLQNDYKEHDTPIGIRLDESFLNEKTFTPFYIVNVDVVDVFDDY
jgi:hypothetical protein